MSRFQELLEALQRLETKFQAQDSEIATFTPFGRLPLELRNKIWKIASHQPRTVRLVHYSISTWPRLLPDVDMAGQLNLEIYGQSRQPAVLHTCAESRKEASRYYELVREQARPFKRLLTREELAAPGAVQEATKPNQYHAPNIVYINFAVDNFLRLLMGPATTDGVSVLQPLNSFNFDNRAINKIERLVVICSACGTCNTLVRKIRRHFRPQLKEITVLFSRSSLLKTDEDSVDATLAMRETAKPFEAALKHQLRTRNLRRAKLSFFVWPVLEKVR
ncbi:uncharacterized protein L3040_008133 [Drepanopeziza brunnea f. sp. 'multigermtubi']|uniref:2EXR domain-containing protein n=1 Tax=Marssonina brunnea f. sp. multigermtubi (strain MB_m1) TaxID=1072389 RepID=K1X1L8_MARBU|nr:uncharacterized protein MBM_03154 [Drepanopeziza brunnea f. sp. 'multigermtubi' MB_m1]EKD18912.1 hypothetical protein MBM_03154 [Drepanopeziza brunnea f. sp. 'multigermtubi' MB_m1]KAJ5034865.1 hypothetical protein L3040_008133 [Drepanopeziza brunnea f. sp. 'multigermtubi']